MYDPDQVRLSLSFSLPLPPPPSLSLSLSLSGGGVQSVRRLTPRFVPMNLVSSWLVLTPDPQFKSTVHLLLNVLNVETNLIRREIGLRGVESLIHFSFRASLEMSDAT